MLEQLKLTKNAPISRANDDFLNVMKRVIADRNSPVIAEVGVGVGATTIEIARLLDNRGTLHLFDFADRTSELRADLVDLGFTNVEAWGNTRKVNDNYSWNLANLLRRQREEVQKGTFDAVYLDGSHTFIHDAPAALICAELLRPGGHLYLPRQIGLILIHSAY